MNDRLLYERLMPHGPAVRIRRVSDDGATPLTAVLEVDRRAGTPREYGGFPPPLMFCEGASVAEILERLEPHADDDRRVSQLMRVKGLR